MSGQATTVHASCVAIGGRGVLLSGRSGAGKSDLALRLLDRGAMLVSDDYTSLRAIDGRLVAAPPPNIAGRIEIRGLGIVERAFATEVRVCLFVDLEGEVQRMPEHDAVRDVAGLPIPLFALNALEASAPIKVEAALDLIGLKR